MIMTSKKDLIHYIETTFPSTQAMMPEHISQFWKQRNLLHTVDEVIMMGNRFVIPRSLRAEILQSLHAAHQSVTAIKDRARCSVYWPGISKDIELARDGCFQCNRCAPSQAKLPPFEPHIPQSKFVLEVLALKDSAQHFVNSLQPSVFL